MTEITGQDNIIGMPEKFSDKKLKSEPSATGVNKVKKRHFVDMTLLIRSIQRSEGNPDCFGKAENYCDRLDCAWRSYCLPIKHTSLEPVNRET